MAQSTRWGGLLRSGVELVDELLRNELSDVLLKPLPSSSEAMRHSFRGRDAGVRRGLLFAPVRSR